MALKFTLISALLILVAFKATTPSTVTPTTLSPVTTTATPSTVTPTTLSPVTTTATPSTVTPTTLSPVTTTATPSTVTPTTLSPVTTTTAPSTVTTATTPKPVTTATTPSTVNTTTLTPGTPTTPTPGSTKDSSPTQGPPATEAPDPCLLGACGSGSTCENRGNMTFICLCLPGDSYNDESHSCERSKVFPGQLTIIKPYDEKMKDKTSQTFRETSNEITSAIDKAFRAAAKDMYSHSVVLELRNGAARNNKVDAAIEIIFKANSDITDAFVDEQMEKQATCEACSLKGSSFTVESLCKSKACDEKTTKCSSEDGSFTCSCAEGYIPTDYTTRICLECPSGQKAKDSKCTACAFGYTGFNCEDSQLLSTVIAASVLGGLLLIALILLPIIALKSKKKSPKSKNVDIGKPYVSHSLPKAPQVNSSMHNGHSNSYHGAANGGGVPRIPRATTTNDWDSRTNLEMTPSNSRQNLIPAGRNTRLNDDQDEMFTFGQSRPQNNPYDDIGSQRNPYDQIGGQRNPYDQIGGQGNPYAQNRASNPYAQSRGTTNPYYM